MSRGPGRFGRHNRVAIDSSLLDDADGFPQVVEPAIRFGRFDFRANERREIQQINARIVGRIRFGHFLGAIRQTHDPRRRAVENQRLWFRKQGIRGQILAFQSLFVRTALAVLIVDPTTNISGQFQMSSLILSDGHECGLRARSTKLISFRSYAEYWVCFNCWRKKSVLFSNQCQRFKVARKKDSR